MPSPMPLVEPVTMAALPASGRVAVGPIAASALVLMSM